MSKITPERARQIALVLADIRFQLMLIEEDELLQVISDMRRDEAKQVLQLLIDLKKALPQESNRR